MSELVIRTYAGGVLVGTRVVVIPDPTPEQVNGALLREQATAALAANTAFRALDPPTTGQAVAQVRALSLQVNKLIRLVVPGHLDSTD